VGFLFLLPTKKSWVGSVRFIRPFFGPPGVAPQSCEIHHFSKTLPLSRYLLFPLLARSSPACYNLVCSACSTSLHLARSIVPASPQNFPLSNPTLPRVDTSARAAHVYTFCIFRLANPWNTPPVICEKRWESRPPLIFLIDRFPPSPPLRCCLKDFPAFPIGLVCVAPPLEVNLLHPVDEAIHFPTSLFLITP